MTGSEALPPTEFGATGSTPVGRRHTKRNVAVLGGVALLLAVAGFAATTMSAGSSLDLVASQDTGGAFGAEALKSLAFTVTGGKASDLTLTLDGMPVTGTREGDATVFRPAGLAEGKHTIAASAPGGLLGRKASASKSFEVDLTAPVVTVDKPAAPANLRSAFTLTGRAEGASALKIDDAVVELGQDGAFSKAYEAAPLGAKIIATDAAGNVTEQTADLNITYPGMRAVHLTALAWKADFLREPVLALIKEKKIDTVQLDIKDEEGIIGYASQVPLAQEAGAAKGIYDAREALDTLHGLGVRVVGRIVAFRDPLLARWSVKNNKLDYVVQDEAGNAYNAGTYGAASFTNFANADVRKYNIDLSVEAAKLGFDDILYDYIRRPEGKLSIQRFPGIGDSTPEQMIAQFVDEAEEPIHQAGAFVGASVFGISSFTPFSVAQNIPLMAPHLDYIAPLIYPSHWGPGEFSVASPNNQPYDIVKRSLQDFNRQVLGTKAQIIPWLQDFSLGVSYGPDKVAAQIRAAQDVGINSWVMWNASAKYQAGAYAAKEASTDTPGTIVYSISKPGNNSDGTTDATAAKEYIDAYYAAKTAGTEVTAPNAAPNGSSTTAGNATPAPSASAAAPPAGVATTEPTPTPAVTSHPASTPTSTP